MVEEVHLPQGKVNYEKMQIERINKDSVVEQTYKIKRTSDNKRARPDETERNNATNFQLNLKEQSRLLVDKRD